MNKRYKHIISMALAGWIAILSSGALAQTSTQNYIHTIEAGIASTSNPLNYISEDSRSSIQYLDGLGRPVQTVLVKQGGDYYDIVSKTEYNYLNKVAKEWLPIEGSFNGAFITASEYAQKASSYYDNDEPYTLTTY